MATSVIPKSLASEVNALDAKLILGGSYNPTYVRYAVSGTTMSMRVGTDSSNYLQLQLNANNIVYSQVVDGTSTNIWTK